jgi:hypothetical protein
MIEEVKGEHDSAFAVHRNKSAIANPPTLERCQAVPTGLETLPHIKDR